jgi:glucosamine-6-phosphate deaminase
MPASRERVPVVVVEYDEIARTIATRIAQIIKERRAEGSHAVLGLATGSTPIGIYRELIKMHKEEGLDFSDVVTFNLDEYYPMNPDSIHSYHRYMWENLFNHINVKRENIHIPRGDAPRDDVDEECDAYEAAIKKAGGIDLQILGIGKTGHIGFNEPGSGVDSRTRRISLDTVTRRDAAADFFGEDNVPTEAITPAASERRVLRRLRRSRGSHSHSHSVGRGRSEVDTRDGDRSGHLAERDDE